MCARVGVRVARPRATLTGAGRVKGGDGPCPRIQLQVRQGQWLRRRVEEVDDGAATKRSVVAAAGDLEVSGAHGSRGAVPRSSW